MAEAPVVLVLAALEDLMSAGVTVTVMALAGSPLADLTLQQWRALRVIERGARVGEVADGMGVSIQSASKIVKRLVLRGLVEIRHDSMDDRARWVVCTPAGVAASKDVRARRQSIIAVALGDQTLRPEFQAELVRLSELLIEYR